MVGYTPEELTSLKHSGWGRGTLVELDTPLRKIISPVLPALTILVGSGFEPREVAHIRAIIGHLTRWCHSVSTILIRVHADIWRCSNSNNLHHAVVMLSSLTPNFQLHTVHSRHHLSINIVKTAQGVVSTSRLSLDAINATTLSDLSTLPCLLSLAIAPPTTNAPFSDAVSVLCASLRAFRNLQKIALPLEILSDIKKVLDYVSSLPCCVEIEFLASPSFVLTPNKRTIVVRALGQGLKGFNHLRSIVLPFDLAKDLTPVLATVGDLRYINETPYLNRRDGSISHNLGTLR